MNIHLVPQQLDAVLSFKVPDIRLSLTETFIINTENFSDDSHICQSAMKLLTFFLQLT